MQRAIDDGVITEGTTVFDYGCGRGGDVKRLAERGFDVAGYDPGYLPDAPLIASDVVNIGYVINVIEDPDERAQAVRRAFELARRVLVVSARLESDAKRLSGDAFSDGVITGAETFQRVYTQEELRQWIDATLGASSVAAAPGVFYVFRERRGEQDFLARRARRRSERSATRVADRLFDEHREALEGLLEFLDEHGRLPRIGEDARGDRAAAEVGSIKRAFRCLEHVIGEERWDEVRSRHYEDLLVFLALARFTRRGRMTDLPLGLQYSVRDFFGSYKAACELADDLLFALGATDAVRKAARFAPVGKQTPSALYVHVTALDELPALLRVYVGCAQALLGVVDDATLVKLSVEKPQVSFLCYPDFDSIPHPPLSWSMSANLQSLKTGFRDWSGAGNPPILHRKEEFVSQGYPRRATFARLTRAEEAAGLFANPEAIGLRRGWNSELARRGVELRGHRLVRAAPGRPSGP